MQKNYGIKFCGIGAALPKKVVKNIELQELFDTSDEWIFTRTGIKERRVVSQDESGLTLSLEASKQALEQANLNPADVDLIIVCTTTPDKLYPSTSCLLQGELGAHKAASFDLSAACSGFIFGIVTAAQFIYTGEYKNILVVGVDVHSRFIDWKDRSVAVLFGDGAGAVLMTSCLARDDELLGYSISSKADKKLDLLLDNQNVTYPICKSSSIPNYVHMNGKAIYEFAIKVVPDVSLSLLDKLNLKTSQIDYFVPHQANQRIIDITAEKLGFNKSKVISNIQNVGNTSAASIPLVIVDKLRSKSMKIPCKMLLVGFGAGLTWGALVMNWNLKL